MSPIRNIPGSTSHRTAQPGTPGRAPAHGPGTGSARPKHESSDHGPAPQPAGGPTPGVRPPYWHRPGQTINADELKEFGKEKSAPSFHFRERPNRQVPTGAAQGAPANPSNSGSASPSQGTAPQPAKISAETKIKNILATIDRKAQAEYDRRKQEKLRETGQPQVRS